jgi:hypothetical protein
VSTTGWGLVAGLAGILTALVCWSLLRKRCASVEKGHKDTVSLNNQRWTECSGRIDQLDRNVELLELSAQNIEHVGRIGLMRSQRSQAMHLLRSGMSPDSAAANLGIARREMRLISKVSNILSLQ